MCLITALFASGVYDFFVNVELNGCAMTYMYEWPTYVPVRDLPEAVAAAHPNYGLYAYGEGESVRRLEEGEFGGIPVLFIPGNSGSYKQARKKLLYKSKCLSNAMFMPGLTKSGS